MFWQANNIFLGQEFDGVMITELVLEILLMLLVYLKVDSILQVKIGIILL
jgi:hypothetical protein